MKFINNLSALYAYYSSGLRDYIAASYVRKWEAEIEEMKNWTPAQRELALKSEEKVCQAHVDSFLLNREINKVLTSMVLIAGVFLLLR